VIQVVSIRSAPDVFRFCNVAGVRAMAEWEEKKAAYDKEAPAIASDLLPTQLK
jgi:hypothetical protein